MEHVLRCKQCDAEMTLLPLPSIEGEAHGLHVRIDGLPALRCANGHRRFVAPTFPTMLLDQLLSVSGLVPLDSASEKGFLRKRYCCPSCGAVLDTHNASRVHSDHSLAIDGSPPLAVHMDLPAYSCARCGHECVEPLDSIVNDLMQASAHAYRSAQIAPS